MGFCMLSSRYQWIITTGPTWSQAQQVPLPPGEWLQREVESEEVGVNRPRKMCLGEKVVQL